MKIALASNNYPPEFLGGTERVVQALARALVEAGDEVVILSGTERPLEEEEKEKEEEEEEEEESHGSDPGILVHRLPLSREEVYGLDVTRPRLLGRLRQLLLAEEFELLHVHHWSHLSQGMLRLAKELGLARLATLHDMWTHCPRFFRSPPRTEAGSGQHLVCPTDSDHSPCIPCLNLDLNAAAAVARDALSGRDASVGEELQAAQFLTAPSQSCAEAAARHLRAPALPEIRVVPHGLLELPKEKKEKSSGSQGPPFKIGSFGNLGAEKGMADLVQALAGLPGLELHLHGAFPDQDFRRCLEQQADDLEVTLTLHGPYDETTPHPAVNMDLAVFPSRCQETYGLVVEEALARAVPVIVSDRGALPERLGFSCSPEEGEHGGGLVVPAGDVIHLRQAITSLAADPRALARLRHTIPSSFNSIQDAASEYRQLYARAQEMVTRA